MSPLLQSQVLVLNRLWQAVHVCSARRAFLLLYQGVAQVVSTDPPSEYSTFDFTEWLRHSCDYGGAEAIGMVSSRLRVPKIIVLRSFDRLPKKDVKFSRQNVFERDRCTCQYCGRQFERDDLNLDHVVPRDRGGQTTWENVVCSCIRCNTRKGNRLPLEAGMRLLRVPRKPRWHPLNAFTLSHQPDASWQKFVDVTFWQVELGDAA